MPEAPFDQAYKYGETPVPVTVKSIEPSKPPLQLASIILSDNKKNYPYVA